MLTRRSFLSFLAAVPVLGRLVAKPSRGECIVWSSRRHTRCVTEVGEIEIVNKDRTIGWLRVRYSDGSRKWLRCDPLIPKDLIGTPWEDRHA